MPCRQALYRLADEMDARGGKLAVVLAGGDKGVERVLGFNNGALATRIRRGSWRYWCSSTSSTRFT